MYKLLVVLITLGFMKCEKPAPQKPTVIASNTYSDTIALNAVRDTVLNQVAIEQPSDSITFSEYDQNTMTYSNVENKILYVSYSKTGSNKKAYVKFPEKNIDEILITNDMTSETYTKNNIKWATDKNRRLGKLTIHGTWFEFIIKE